MTVAPQTGWPPTVGRYLLYGEIASGGMATVHFGRLQGAAGFARSVAIKRLHPQYAKDPDFVGMFLDEARLAARIAHPNVVPTLDVVAQGDELLLVMEYVRGSSLSRLLRTLTQRGERMPPRIAAAIIAGVLRGLHAAHEAKSEIGEKLEIVHRDVSPQNVLVGTDGIARVLDFGVAKAAGRVQTTREGQLKGKLAYMAPEQITTGSVTRKTDVYAAAVVLWEMLTGRRLFRADNEAKLLTLVLDSEILAPSKVVDGLPAGFDPVVLHGLDRDPGRRFESARQMAMEVEGVVGIAPPTEIGEWVEEVAADELRERANRIEEIERSVIGSSPGIGAHPWPAVTPTSGVSRRVDEPSTVQHGGGRGAPLRSVLPPPAPPPRPMVPPPARLPKPSLVPVSQVSQVSQLSRAGEPGSSRKRSAGIIVAALLVCGVVAAAVFFIRPLRLQAAALVGPAASGTPAGPAGAASIAVEPIVTRPSTSAVPPPKPAPIAVDDGPPTLSLKQPPKPPPVVNVAPPVPQQIQVAPPPPPPPRKIITPQPTNECNPPYTTDDKGHIHFKPACVN